MEGPKPSCNTICAVFPTIVPLLDLSELIVLSRTCQTLQRAFQSLCVDEDTQRIKLSEYAISRDSPLKARSPRHVLCAFNSIHFPSLKRLHLDFSAVCSPRRDENRFDVHQSCRDEAAAVAFPVLVANLAYAKNLEIFFFHGSALLSNHVHDESGLYPEFGRNLAKCEKLREIEIVNIHEILERDDDGQILGNAILFSFGLTSALAYVVAKRKDTLQKLTLITGGSPLGFTPSRGLLSMGETHSGEVYDKLLIAIRSCNKLNSLEICATASPAKDLNRIASNVDGEDHHFRQDATNLRNLSLRLMPTRLGVLPDNQTFYPLMKLFSNLNSLEHVNIEFNEALWKGDGVIELVGDVLKNQKNIKHFDLKFGGLCADERTSERALRAIEMCALHSHSLGSLSINRLLGVDATHFCRLVDDLTKKGMSLSKGDVEFSKLSCLWEEGREGVIMGMQPQEGSADIRCLQMAGPKHSPRPHCRRYGQFLSNYLKDHSGVLP